MVSHGGSGADIRVFVEVNVEGCAWRRRWESWVQRFEGICFVSGVARCWFTIQYLLEERGGLAGGKEIGDIVKICGKRRDTVRREILCLFLFCHE